MPPIDTKAWLHQYVKECKDLRGSYPVHCAFLCNPLVNLFPNMNPEELHYVLLKYGLFSPEEDVGEILTTLNAMIKQHIWEMVEKEFNYLKEMWNGPDLPLYIYPIQKAHLPTINGYSRKNGVTFHNALFLFLSPYVANEEIKALLAHEYNHVCRLNYLNESMEGLSLKESLVLEGIAECAVKELYGEKWLAPWTKIYTYENVLPIWEEKFIPQLNVRGNETHQLFLYGSEGDSLPKWIGYNIGYQIVHSYCKNNCNTTNLLTTPTDEIITGSNFFI